MHCFLPTFFLPTFFFYPRAECGRDSHNIQNLFNHFFFFAVREREKCSLSDSWHSSPSSHVPCTVLKLFLPRTFILTPFLLCPPHFHLILLAQSPSSPSHLHSTSIFPYRLILFVSPPSLSCLLLCSPPLVHLRYRCVIFQFAVIIFTFASHFPHDPLPYFLPRSSSRLRVLHVLFIILFCHGFCCFFALSYALPSSASILPVTFSSYRIWCHFSFKQREET